jgi:hypothetical protein
MKSSRDGFFLAMFISADSTAQPPSRPRAGIHSSSARSERPNFARRAIIVSLGAKIMLSASARRGGRLWSIKSFTPPACRPCVVQSLAHLGPAQVATQIIEQLGRRILPPLPLERGEPWKLPFATRSAVRTSALGRAQSCASWVAATTATLRRHRNPDQQRKVPRFARTPAGDVSSRAKNEFRRRSSALEKSAYHQT